MKRIDTFALGLGILAAAWISWMLSHRDQVQTIPSAPEPVVTAKKLEPLPETSTVLEFQQYTEALTHQLPTADDLKSEHERFFHSTPQSIRNFAPKLAHVQTLMRSDARNVEAGTRFYEKCATDHTALVTIRAVCLKMFRIWDKHTEIPVSDEIVQVSTALPGDEL